MATPGLVKSQAIEHRGQDQSLVLDVPPLATLYFEPAA